MSLLVLGLVLFLGVHSVSIVAPAWRDERVARLGRARWQGAYALISAVGLGLVIHGYGLARQQPVIVYQPPTALRHLVLLLMLPVFPLLLAAYLPGRIQARMKHPMLVAVKIWALSHLLANGGAHDLLLFGSFLLWAGLDRASFKRRVPRPVAGAPPGPYNDLIALVGGLALYGLMLVWGHRALTGMPLLPG